MPKLTEKEEVVLLNLRNGNTKRHLAFRKVPYSERSVVYAIKGLKNHGIVTVSGETIFVTPLGSKIRDELRKKYPLDDNITPYGIWVADWSERRVNRKNVIDPTNGEISKTLKNKYFTHVDKAVDKIEKILSKRGLKLVNEDGTPFSAIFTGSSARSRINLAVRDYRTGTFYMVKNSMLILSWYMMQSGNYEVTAYLS